MSADDVLTAGERDQLAGFLREQRDEIAGLLDGITEDQARTRLVASETCLLAIVKHCAFVERVWFAAAMQQLRRSELGLPERAQDSWTLEPTDTVDSVRRDFVAACAAGDAIAAGTDLEALALGNRRSPMSLRWIYLHLIREYARHAGHGDILRELLIPPDAPTVDP